VRGGDTAWLGCAGASKHLHVHVYLNVHHLHVSPVLPISWHLTWTRLAPSCRTRVSGARSSTASQAPCSVPGGTGTTGRYHGKTDTVHHRQDMCRVSIQGTEMYEYTTESQEYEGGLQVPRGALLKLTTISYTFRLILSALPLQYIDIHLWQWHTPGIGIGS
jgi:hypothetical protein